MRSIYPCNQAKIAAGGATLSGTPVKVIQYDTYTWAVFSGSKVYVFNSNT
jgi:hypothetical protein